MKYIEPESRYIPFEFHIEDPEDFIIKRREEIKLQLKQGMFNIETHLTPDSIEMISSQGKEFKDGGIYIGTAGNLYYCYSKIKYLEEIDDHEELKEAYESFDLAFDTNAEVWKLMSMDQRSIPSFFMGITGMMTLGYIVYDKLGNKSKSEMWLNRILAFVELPLEEAELLYGKSGLLFSLLKIKDYNPKCTEVDFPILSVTIEIIEAGLVNYTDETLMKNSILEYEFPARSGRRYIGAAHGYIGILYMILKAFEYIPIQEIPNKYHRMIKNTCEYILSLQNEEGNFPLMDEYEMADWIHWCHGAPGAIPFLIQWYEYYFEEKYLTAAIKSGELVRI